VRDALLQWNLILIEQNFGEKNEAPWDDATWDFQCGRTRSITNGVPSNHKISEFVDWGSG
jgi:hypothetical protein